MGTKKKSTAAALSGGVGDALFSKVRQRVLGILFGNPARSFYANELITLADCGIGAVPTTCAI